MTSEAEYHRKVKQLEQELQQAKAREEQAKAREEEAKAREEQERREKEEAKAREEQERREKEQLERQIQKTTLEDYLLDCHLYLFKALQIADISLSSTGRATNVNGKYYPLWLHRWENFPNHHRDHFDRIKDICGRKQLFSQSIATRDKTQDACMNPAAYERDVETFLRVAVEVPAFRILQRLVEEDFSICQEFNFSELRFSCNHRELKQESGSDQAMGDKNTRAGVQKRPRRSGPRKRVTSDQHIKTSEPAYPDGYGIRTYPEGSKDAAFVYDSKAAHKLTTQDLHQALAKEKLFMEVTERICGNKVSSDKELNKQDAANVKVAMALTQVFHYMVTYGVAYGYITAGKYLLFLHVKKENLKTLYYHLCDPDEEADNRNGTVDLFHTAVAQLVSFCLLSLRSKPVVGFLVDKATGEVILKEWGNPYDEAASLVSIKGVGSSQSEPSSQGAATSDYAPPLKALPAPREFVLRSRSTCKDVTTIRKDDQDDDEEQDDGRSQVPRMPGTSGANKRKEGPSSSSSAGNNRESSSDSCSPPAGQYCTQGCLLGLKRGWDLDEKCPNVSLHRTVESGTRHPINASELASLIEERLRQNPYRDCIALDPYGFSGKIGTIGALFKLSLARYGYTLVAKGTQSAHLSRLLHERRIYSRLEKLQGEVLPVFLGIVDLTGGYLLPGGARVMHMMLMSWGGEVAAEVGLPDISAMVRRSSQAVRNEGVVHGDEREPNMLWNEERGRIMLIDFDRASLGPGAKHRKISTFSVKRKLRHVVDSCDRKHARPTYAAAKLGAELCDRTKQ